MAKAATLKVIVIIGLAAIAGAVGYRVAVPEVSQAEVGRSIIDAIHAGDAATLLRHTNATEREALDLNEEKIQKLLDSLITPHLATYKRTRDMTFGTVFEGASMNVYQPYRAADGRTFTIDFSIEPGRQPKGAIVSTLVLMGCMLKYMEASPGADHAQRRLAAIIRGLEQEKELLAELKLPGFVQDVEFGGMIPWEKYRAYQADKFENAYGRETNRDPD